MSIYLIRHGETLLNVARQLQPADTPLSPHGRRQAEALARRMAPLGLRRIVSSDLPRAAQTAQALSAVTGLPIEWTPLLQERNFGDWRGRAYDDFDFNPLTTHEAPPNGESAAQFDARVAQAFALLTRLRAECDGAVAAVTHGLVIRAMVGVHAPLGADMVAPHRLGNTSVTQIGHQAPYVIELLDCVQHLDADTKDDVRSLSGG